MSNLVSAVLDVLPDEVLIFHLIDLLEKVTVRDAFLLRGSLNHRPRKEHSSSVSSDGVTPICFVGSLGNMGRNIRKFLPTHSLRPHLVDRRIVTVEIATHRETARH